MFPHMMVSLEAFLNKKKYCTIWSILVLVKRKFYIGGENVHFLSQRTQLVAQIDYHIVGSGDLIYTIQGARLHRPLLEQPGFNIFSPIRNSYI